MAKYFGHRSRWSGGGTKHATPSGPLPQPPMSKGQLMPYGMPSGAPKEGQIIPPNRGQYPRGHSVPTVPGGGWKAADRAKLARNMLRTPEGARRAARMFGMAALKQMFPWLTLMDLLEMMADGTVSEWFRTAEGGVVQNQWTNFDLIKECPDSGPGACPGSLGPKYGTRPVTYTVPVNCTPCQNHGWIYDTFPDAAASAGANDVGEYVTYAPRRSVGIAPVTHIWRRNATGVPEPVTLPDYYAPPIPFVPPVPEGDPKGRGFQYPRPNRRNVPKHWMPSWSKPGGSTGGGGSTGDWGSPNPAPPITKPEVDDDDDLPTVHRPPYERPAVQIPMGPKGPGKPVVVIHKDLPAQYPIKEVKWKLPRSKLGDFYGALTEFKDFLAAANAAIPGNPCGSGGLHTRFACVVKHAGQIDPAVFMREAARMQLEDYTIGKANQLANQITRSPYWRSPKGIGFGSFSQRMR